MIEPLPAPEIPVVNTLTNRKIESLFIQFQPDGSAAVSITRVKGYMEAGNFIADPNSREQIAIDGLAISAATTAGQMYQDVEAKVAERIAKPPTKGPVP